MQISESVNARNFVFEIIPCFEINVRIVQNLENIERLFWLTTSVQQNLFEKHWEADGFNVVIFHTHCLSTRL